MQWVHLREGYGIPYVQAHAHQVMNSYDLEQQHVEMHFNPKKEANGGEFSWNARLYFINDEGIKLKTVDNINEYEVMVSSTSTRTTTSDVSIKFNTIQAAFNYGVVDGCHEVNKNDIVSKLVFFGFDELSFRTEIPDIAVKIKATETPHNDWAVATYDSDTKMLTVKLGSDAEHNNGICIESISEITFS